MTTPVPATILVVDDEPQNREVLVSLLGPDGYTLLEAADGEEALALAASHRPDLVLLDIMMPKVDGLAVCRTLRADPALAEIPIILVTALDDRATRLQGLTAGADDFLTKPVDRIELRARVRTITRMNRYRKLLEERAELEHAHRDLQATLEAAERFVPHQFLQLLGRKSITEVQLADQVETQLTILFSDIRDFTALSESMSPQQNFNMINSYLQKMEPVIVEHHGLVDKFIGDAIMALFPRSAEDAVRAAVVMLETLGPYNAGRNRAGYVPVRIGIGLNTGLTRLGTVGGRNRMDGTVISDAVNMAARLESLTKLYGIGLIIGEPTYHSLTSPSAHHIRFLDRVLLKGKRRPQSVYEVFDADPPALRDAKRATAGSFEEALACYHFRRVADAQRLLEACLRAHPDDRPAQVYQERCAEYLRTGRHQGATELDGVLPWTAELQVGSPAIDRQHQELFRHARELVEAVHQATRQEEVPRRIAFLEEYARSHFAAEEALMAERGYPLLEAQREQHASFSRGVARLAAEIRDRREGQAYPLFRLQIFLVDWLVNHLATEDQRLGRFLREQAQGG